MGFRKIKWLPWARPVCHVDLSGSEAGDPPSSSRRHCGTRALLTRQDKKPQCLGATSPRGRHGGSPLPAGHHPGHPTSGRTGLRGQRCEDAEGYQKRGAVATAPHPPHGPRYPALPAAGSRRTYTTRSRASIATRSCANTRAPCDCCRAGRCPEAAGPELAVTSLPAAATLWTPGGAGGLCGWNRVVSLVARFCDASAPEFKALSNKASRSFTCTPVCLS